MGLTFSWWQEQASQLILGKTADGIYATSESSACLSIPRQTGKTTLIGGLVMALCLLHGGMTVLWTAHRLRTSNMTFSKMRLMCARPQIKPLVDHVRLANGEGEIEFVNGSKILFGARGQGFGLGFDAVDVTVFDEAQRLSQAALEDMVPTTSVIENALILLLGTPPRPDDDGGAFRERRALALDGNPDNVLWVEFGADDDTDVAAWSSSYIDWEQVAKANPSYPDLVSKTAIRRLKNNLKESFAREGLGLWDIEAVDRLVPVDQWTDQLVTSDSEVLPEAERIVGNVVACVDVSHDRTTAWIAVCGTRADGIPQVEIAATLPPIRVAGWLEDHADRVTAVTAQSRGAGMSSELLAQLAADKTFRLKTEDWLGPELMAAHGRALDALRDHEVRTALNTDLEIAVAGAAGKELGGGVVIDRRKSASEVAPLVAWVGAYGLWTRPRQQEELRVEPATPKPIPASTTGAGVGTAGTAMNVMRIGF